MKKMKYIIFVITILFISSFVIVNKTKSKYVISDNKTAFHIGQLMNDNIKPTITVNTSSGSEKNITDETYNSDKDVTIGYDDNTKVESAQYWYNEKNKSFSGDGKTFDKYAKFTKEGWYKIVITDIFGNTNTCIILIDKTPPEVTVKFYKKNEVSILEKVNIRGGVC